MTLQKKGAISLQDIAEEYNGTSPYSLSQYSEHVAKLPGDTIAISEFYGLSAKTILLQDKTFDVYTTRQTVIPIANILAGSIDEYSDSKDAIKLVAVTNPQFGNVVIDGVNVLFTSTGPTGSAASFDIVVENSIGIQKRHRVTMRVIAIPPVICNPDTFSLQQGEALLLSSQQLLQNDEDFSNTGLTFLGVSHPLGGTVSYSGNTITFTSTGLAGQPAEFNYRVRSGQGQEQTGTVYVNITPLPELEAFVYRTKAEAEQATANYSPPTMKEVFNNWARFNGNEYYANRQAAIDKNSSNAKAWTYNAQTDSVVMPLNVSPANGFVSLEKVDNYTFEATLTSNHGDNDTIGVVAAFVREGSINYVLTLVLNTGGTAPASTGCGVYFGYAGVGSGSDQLLGQYNIGTGSGWSNRKARVKVQRQGDIFTFYVTKWNDVNNFQSASKMVVDLNSNSGLQRFKGKQSYGYITSSQPNSTYLDIRFKGGLDTNKIYEAQTNTVWEYVGNSWQQVSGTIQSHLGYIRKVFNPETQERYHITATLVTRLGRLVANSAWLREKLIDQRQYVLVDEDLAKHGAASNVRLLALYAPSKEEKNYLKDTPILQTNSAHRHNAATPGFNNLGVKNWFSEHSIDLVSTNFIGGTLVFDGGIVGRITAIGNDNGTSAYVHYQVVNYRLFDLTV